MDDMTSSAADGPPSTPRTGAHAAAGILGTWERTADGILFLDGDAAAALLGEGSRSGASMPAAEYASMLRLRDRARLANALFHAGPGRTHRVAYAIVVDGVERRIVERGRFRAAAGGGMSGIGVLMDADEDDPPGTDRDATLEGVATDCLDIRRRLEALGGAEHLKAMLDAVLIGIGRELARSIRT